LNSFKPLSYNAPLSPSRTEAGKGYRRDRGQWGLLGGSGKARDETSKPRPSKLASLAASRKAKENRSTPVDKSGSASLSSVARLASLSSASPVPISEKSTKALNKSAINTKDTKASIDSKPSEIAEHLGNSTADHLPQDSRLNLLTMPSSFAGTLFHFLHLPNHLTNFSQLLTDFYPPATKVQIQSKTPFASPSPDDLVKSAQRNLDRNQIINEPRREQPQIGAPRGIQSGDKGPIQNNDTTGVAEGIKSITLKDQEPVEAGNQLPSKSPRAKRRTLAEIKAYLDGLQKSSVSFVIIGNIITKNELMVSRSCRCRQEYTDGTSVIRSRDCGRTNIAAV